VNCDACPIDGVPKDIWLNPPYVEPLAHFGHDAHEILAIAVDFDRPRGGWATIRWMQLFPRRDAAPTP
jgi:hypothetical protein